MAKQIFSVLTVVFGAITAFLWFRSASVEVIVNENNRDSRKLSSAVVSTTNNQGDKIDFIGTAQSQAMWNKWAAIASAVTAACQIIEKILPAHT